jgi:UDP-N-acetylmuramate dehydrogenase
MRAFQGLEGFVREQVPLADLTSYRVGGPAEFLATPPDEAGLGAVLTRAAEAGLPVHVLGSGTNLLVADEGVRGLVVKLPRDGFGDLELDGMTLRVGAGHSLPGLVKWALGEGWGGLEFLAGVPGTVGAALRMNAGGKYGRIGSCVSCASGLELDGRPFRLDAERCGFEYRDSRLRERIVTRCELELEAIPPGESGALYGRILAEKAASQPLHARSAGCVFKNPQTHGVPPAGRLIEELGLKGMRAGGASVSLRHANFLVCSGETRAADIVELIRTVRRCAWAERGVRLELEIAVWGIRPEELWPAEAA